MRTPERCVLLRTAVTRRLALFRFAFLVAVSALAAHADAATGGFTIQADRALGGVAMGSRLADAAAVFGDPVIVRRRNRVECRVTWPRLGLTATLLDLSSSQPCSAGGVSATVISGLWHTTKGLRVRDPLSRLRALYQSAARFDGAGRSYVDGSFSG